MKVRLNIDVMRANLEGIRQFAQKRELLLSFMVKHQFWSDFMVDLLKDEQVYTNKTVIGWENIYESPRITIVDAFDRREGLTLDEARQVENKDIAIVNFCCCNGKMPAEENLVHIAEHLHTAGFKRVSFGGSLLLRYRNVAGDEIRVGEALLTGYSSEPYESYFIGMRNPFELDLEVWSSSKDGVVVRHGFMELGGFTDVRTKCVNTDFSVLDVKDWKKYQKGDVITVQPDYYTLIKIADKWRMTNVEVQSCLRA